MCPLTQCIVLCLLFPNLSPHHHLLSPFFSSQQQQQLISSLIISMAEPISLPPHHQPPHETTTTTPELNLAVIIAALLCALLCALGLNSMLQCVFQCTHRTLTEPVEWVASRKLNSGLKKKDIVALPTSTYAENNNSRSPLPSSSSPVSVGGCCCAICLVDFSDGDKIRVLPQCDHRFHVACIDEWLLSHSFCPTCRRCLKSNNCAPCLEIVTAL